MQLSLFDAAALAPVAAPRDVERLAAEYRREKDAADRFLGCDRDDSDLDP